MSVRTEKTEPSLERNDMIYVMDPVSPEENRGSFCYLPYYLFSALQSRMVKSCLYEDFSITDKETIDKITKEDTVYVSLWSYPQIETCHIIHRRIPHARFFGYTPLILQEGLPLIDSYEWIEDGIRAYPFLIRYFKHILLSDCDGHLKDRPNVFPLVTSYGCKRNCSFCPVTPNLDKVIDMPVDDVLEALSYYKSVDRNCGVHFTDEDFFSNTSRAVEILIKASSFAEWGFIALASVTSFTRFLDSFENDDEAFSFCNQTGLYLIEVGLETGDAELAKSMGKPAFSKSVELAERMKHPEAPKALWLTMTFSPGETIRSLSATGSFLREYGLDPKEMSVRIRTNGTVGGMGQFFQIYTGTRGEKRALSEGIPLTPRPMRLVPSYIPSSFLNCSMHQIRKWNDEDLYWLDLYGLDLNSLCPGTLNYSQVYNFVFPKEGKVDRVSVTNRALLVALAARLGVVEQ